MTPRIKERPEDFIVEEIPAYEPCGEGEHLYIRFTKRDLSTEDAARSIAGALGVDPRAASWAGMKDKHAVTTQTISLHDRSPDLESRALALSLAGITILSARRHTNKLKPGHLAGNRFEIVVRGVEDVGATLAALERVGREGLPNAFGEQRFGAHNVERARSWIVERRARPPRDPRARRFDWSVLQAAIFNELLRARVADGTWATPLEGDLLKRRTSGGLFVCADVQTDRERAVAGEVSPTGPIYGAKMRSPTSRPAELERAAIGRILGDAFDVNSTKHLGEGSRRALRLWVEEMRAVALEGEEVDGVRVYFVLPKGSYATTVLAAAIQGGGDRDEVNEDEGQENEPT